MCDCTAEIIGKLSNDFASIFRLGAVGMFYSFQSASLPVESCDITFRLVNPRSSRSDIGTSDGSRADVRSDCTVSGLGRSVVELLVCL